MHSSSFFNLDCLICDDLLPCDESYIAAVSKPVTSSPYPTLTQIDLIELIDEFLGVLENSNYSPSDLPEIFIENNELDEFLHDVTNPLRIGISYKVHELFENFEERELQKTTNFINKRESGLKIYKTKRKRIRRNKCT